MKTPTKRARPIAPKNVSDEEFINEIDEANIKTMQYRDLLALLAIGWRLSGQTLNFFLDG